MNIKHIISQHKSKLIDLLIILFFLVVTIIYFKPSIFDDKALNQADVAGTAGNGRDTKLYEEQTGEKSYWTNSLFSGMPTYQIAPSYPSNQGIFTLEKIISFRAPIELLKGDSWLLFSMMLGFFIFMRSLNISKMLSILGSIAWAFSSYFIILFIAGHLWKLEALCFIPPTIAGLIWLYRGDYLKGLVITSIFATLQIYGNHIQMSYYFAFVMLFIAVAFIIDALKKKNYKHIIKASSLLILSGAIAILANSTSLYHTYKYSKETMRGGSELKSKEQKQNDGGLSNEYITQWSYGKAETFSLLVPNIHGGVSEPLYVDSEKKLEQVNPNIRQYVAEMSSYWGEQPFTAGPVYVGAFIFIMFIISLFIVKSPIKWALVFATIFSILLSWGHNFSTLTDFFIAYIPLYNKFRAVSSILVIAEFTIPTLAIMGLCKFFENPKLVWNENKKYIILSVSLVVIIILFFATIPAAFFDFLSQREIDILKENISNPIYNEVFSALAQVRKSLLVDDAIRSLIFIGLSLSILVFYFKNSRYKILSIVLLILVNIIDLVGISTRYLSWGDFQEKTAINSQITQMTPIDIRILEDKDPHYRVLNLSVNTFNDASTSYHHRSVGGYSAVKMQRYQDLIDRELSRRIPSPVYDMLDVKYIIAPDSTKRISLNTNPNHYGAAWFANNIKWVEDANEEMDNLSMAENLKDLAIIDKRFAGKIDQNKIGVADISDFIRLEKYNVKEIEYKVRLSSPRLAVFSEIYYPDGWTLSIDNSDEKLDIVRANYVLRAALLPKGEYTLRMKFSPETIKISEMIAYSAIIAMMIFVISFLMIKIRKSDDKNLENEKVSKNI